MTHPSVFVPKLAPKLLAACGFALAVLAAPLAEAGTVSAHVLEGYETPATVRIDPLDDNFETMAVAKVVERRLSGQNIKASDDSPVILEFEVVTSAAGATLSPSERAQADTSSAMQRNDNVSRLSASAELDPMASSTNPRPQRAEGKAQMILTINLYRRGSAPIWTATAMARRDLRSLEEQSAELAEKAMALFGQSGAQNF